MNDQLIPFPYRRAGGRSGPSFDSGLGLARAGSSNHDAPGMLAIANDRPLRADLMDWQAASRFADAWADLVSRSLEQNVFLEPGFALTAAQHFPASKRPSFLLVSDTTRPQAEKLIGVCALDVFGGFRPLTHGWLPKQAALGTPLLDRTQGAEAVDVMLAWMERENPRTVGLLLPSMANDGETAALLRTRAAARSLELRVVDMGKRAVLFGGVDVESMLHRAMSAKHIKELRRLRRRLSDLGELTYVTETDPARIRPAVESFLALEAGGWKGGRGTALLNDPATAAFARTMTRRLARDGKCRIEALELNGAPVAMAIVLATGKNAFLWKIAYDEAYAAYSPGVQFTIEFTRRQVMNEQTTSTDSCAIPDHPMIDRLWPDRLPIADIAMSITHGKARAFDGAFRKEMFRRKIRAFAKRAYYAATRRRAS